MSILLDRSLGQIIQSVGTIPTLAFPFAIQFEFQPNDLTQEQALVSISDADGDDYHAIVFDGSQAANPVITRTRAGGTSSDAESTSGLGSSERVTILAIWASDSERSIRINGGSLGTNTDTRIPSGLDRISIGGRNVDLYASMDVADIFIWSDVAFSSGDLGQLAQGISPLLIQPEKLVLHSPLASVSVNPFKDEINHYQFQFINSPVTGTLGTQTVGFSQPMSPPPPVSVINVSVETTLDLTPEVVTNFPSGFPANILDLTPVALNNIIQESVSNELGFSQEALNNIIQESVSNELGFSQEALNNIIERSFLEAINFSLLAENNIKPAFASTTLDLTPEVETNILEISVSTTIDFDSFGGTVKTGEAEANLIFYTAGFNNTYSFGLETTLDLTPSVTADGTERNISVETDLFLTPRSGKTVEGSAETTLDLTPEAARGEKVEHNLELTPSTVGTVSKPATNTLDLNVIVEIEVERNLIVSNDLDFQQGVVGYICPLTSCDFSEYNPVGGLLPSVTIGTRDTITLVCGADSIEIRNPRFGNADTTLPRRAFNISTNLRSHAFRNSVWPKSQTKTFSVDNLKDTQVSEILDFQKNCLGKEITYTDMEERVWIGTLLETSPLVDNGENQNSVSLSFRGVLLSEKTW